MDHPVHDDPQRRALIEARLARMQGQSRRYAALRLLVEIDCTADAIARHVFPGDEAGLGRKMGHLAKSLAEALRGAGLQLIVSGPSGGQLWRGQVWRLRRIEVAPLRHADRRVDLDLSAITDAQALRARLAAAVQDLRPGQLLVFHCSAERPGALLQPAADEVARQMGLALRQWPEDPAHVAARRWSLALECPARSRPGASAKTLGEVAR